MCIGNDDVSDHTVGYKSLCPRCLREENAFKMLFIAAIYLLIYNFLSILIRSRKNFLCTNFVNVLTMYKKNLEFSNFFDSMENLFCEDEVKLLKIIIIILEKYIFIQE